MKKILLFLLLFFPISVFAYSNQVLIGGETIGIEVESKGIYIVGFYEVNGKNIGKEAGFEKGDLIQKIDQQEVDNIKSLNQVLKTEKTYTVEVLRKEKTKTLSLKPILEDDTFKTGLYVKDTIYGIGTLSYIDPETKIFGSLGHEIIENSSFSKFELKKGSIFQAEVSSLSKSGNGKIGEKNARIDTTKKEGNIIKNEKEGIFGIYTSDMDRYDLVEIAKKEEIKKGEAYIRTVISDQKIENFFIDIIAIDENDDVKNIFFEIKDEKLLNSSGGIIQGMSGSPIIQNDKMIGVVNYVVIDESEKGFGIFITNMLEQGDQILN